MLEVAFSLVPREVLVRYACLVARTVLDKVPAGEDRPRIAIETAEAWTRGEATIEEVRAAADAAWDTPRGAYAAAYAADAAYAAAAAYAADAAYAAGANASDAAAYAAAWAQQAGASPEHLADIVRPLWTDVDQAQLTKLAEHLGNDLVLDLIRQWKSGEPDARAVLGDLFEELGYSV
jgi:hypothetical protein